MSKAVVSAAATGLPTRRSLLATLAGTGAALALPTLAKAGEVAVIGGHDPSHPDAALIALWPHLVAVNAREFEATERLGRADKLKFAGRPSPDHEAAEAEELAAHKAWGEACDLVASTAAHTLAGLRIKVAWTPSIEDDSYVMSSIVEDIVAMTGGLPDRPDVRKARA